MALRSLRSTVVALTALLAAVAVAVSVLLVVLTSWIDEVAERLAASVESVRLIQESEVDLLLHERSRDRLVRERLEQQVHRRLAAARSWTFSARQVEALDRAERAAAAYFAHTARGDDQDQALEDAYAAIDVLARLSLQDAQEQRRRATQWNRMADRLGTAAVMLLLALPALLIVWLRRALEPVGNLGRALERFAAGDRETRASEEGPAELSGIARRFNHMASAIARQRERQMQFLAGVAHDLRTPLSALRTSALVLSREPPPRPEDAGRMVRLLQRQVDRLDRQLDDLLDTAALESGRLDLRVVPGQDVAALAREAVELFAPTAPRHALEVSGESGSLTAACDPARIQQVFTNLLSNAIKYSPEGGPVRLSLRAEDHRVVMEVRDEGLGIPPEEHEIVFEPFRRSAGVSTGAIPGAGLGLYVVRRIVEAHGGTIAVASTPGRGSTFRVEIPREAALGPAR